ncbi:MAG: hypothetical protein U1C46_01105 [Bacteroidales bacterium]|nr:hypothetical protein [Bacteroidales bacterium]MDZ4203389.1 hypothetical protein [Bacteroidales bacterium]
MKKILLALILMIAAASVSAAGSSDLFKLDEQRIATEMADLNEIEGYVNSQHLTLSDLLAENNSLAINSLLPAYGAASMASLSEDPPLGIPSFAWGFCFGILGLAIVYFVTEDTAQTKKALWGCIIGTVLWTVISVAANLAAASTI